MTLREVLHAHIPTLTRESTVRDAVDKMDVYQFPALVILDESQPVAVITEGDLCRAVTQRESIVRMATEPAHAYATKDPTTVPADMETSEAFHLMLRSGLTVLPVMDDGNFAGVVFRVDLMHALLLDATPYV